MKLSVFKACIFLLLSLSRNIFCSEYELVQRSTPSFTLFLRKMLLFMHSTKFADYLSFSKRYVDITSPIYNMFGQTTLITPNIHMDVLCSTLAPLEHCWCGFIKKYDDEYHFSVTKPFEMIRICSNYDGWVYHKDTIMELYLDSGNLETDEPVRGSRHRRRNTINNNNGHSNSTSAKTIEKYKGSGLYQHDSGICPKHFSWCWCGLINTMDEYYGLATSDHPPLKPRVLIDCRPFEMRPFETRNCKPNSPLYRRIIGLGPDPYPCGSYDYGSTYF